MLCRRPSVAEHVALISNILLQSQTHSITAWSQEASLKKVQCVNNASNFTVTKITASQNQGGLTNSTTEQVYAKSKPLTTMLLPCKASQIPFLLFFVYLESSLPAGKIKSSEGNLVTL